MNNQNYESYLKEVLKLIGLKDFEGSLSAKPITNPDMSFSLILHTNLTIPYQLAVRTNGESAFIDTVAKALTEPIQNSDFVKSLLWDKEEEIKKLEKQVQDLQIKVADLKPFKMYYDLQFKLTHGKSDENQ